jgi:hypothetical protein
MKSKQTIATVLFAVAAILLGWWFAAGHQMWTTTQKMIEVKDELFGTVTQTWVHEFTPGLEYIGPVAVVLVGVGMWLLWSVKTRSNPNPGNP